MRQGIEGWVVLNYVIQADGTTGDIVVMDASIENYFEKQSINAVSEWVYQPATLDGVPVKESNRTARTTFMIQDLSRGVGRKFLSRYQKARKAIDEDDLPKARKLIDNLKAYKKRLLTEVFYLDFIETFYWQAMKDDQQALKYVERALVMAGDVAPVNAHVALLRQAVVFNAIAHNYGATLDYYQTLIEVGGELEPGDPLYAIDDKIQKSLEGNHTIEYQGLISTCIYCLPSVTYWRHELNRNRFSIDQVDGELSGIEVFCGIRSVSMLYVPETVWSVNQDWGKCEVQVSGDDGTTFRLTEHPKD